MRDKDLELLSKPEAQDQIQNLFTADASGEKPQVSTAFAKALVGFLPTIAGALFGGDTGGAIGAKAGVQGIQALQESDKEAQKQAFALEKEIRDRSFQLEKISRTGSKMDLTPGFVEKGTGQSVTTREIPGGGLEYIKVGTNQVINPANVERSDIALEKLRSENIGGRQEKTLDFGTIRFQEQVISNFQKIPRVKERFDTVKGADTILDLVNSGRPITSDFLSTPLAKGLLGEVGNLADTDRKAAKIPLDLFNTIKSKAKQRVFGDMSQAERDATVSLVQYIKDKNQKYLQDEATRYSTTRRASAVKLSPKDLLEEIQQSAGVPEATAPKETPAPSKPIRTLADLKAERDALEKQRQALAKGSKNE